MSKLIAEADKLLEKGKIPEALEKLKAAQKAEPLNQLVATKLANAYVDNGETDKAVKVFVSLADRLAEAGKAQVAIAIYKQALELDPADVGLKVKFALECEAAGKLSDAQTNANFALKHYLHRKKYFDAANLMPMLVRIQGKDEKLKETWIEILQLSQADQKLIHLLVALCGPPGLVSQEFSVGGEPTTLSPALYESLKKLVPFFPRDPKLAYAVAWAAQRRGNSKDFYSFLRECLRRDPDFCLGLLLLARTLAEKQKLNESLFVYKHMRERVMADKSVDMVTLNRLIDGFVEKNGWINFAEGEVLDAASFRSAIEQMVSPSTGSPPSPPAASAAPPAPPPVGNPAPPVPASAAVPFNPVDLFAPPPSAVPPAPPAVPVPTAPTAEKSSAGEAIDLFASTSAPEPSAPSPAVEAPNRGSPTPTLGTESSIALSADIELGAGGDAEMEVEHTSLTRVFRSPKAQTPVTAPPPPKAAEPEILAANPPPEAVPIAPAEEQSAAKGNFSPLESAPPPVAAAEDLKPALEVGEKTEMFSPMELLGASDRKHGAGAEVKTKMTLNRSEDLAEVDAPRADLPVFPPSAVEPAATRSEMEEQRIEGAATEIFSPMDAIEAGVSSRRPHGAVDSSSDSLAPASAPSEDATMIIPMGAPEALADEAAPAEEPPAFALPETSAEPPSAATAPKGFMPIPELSIAAQAANGGAGSEDEDIDLGDDLLNDPTRILVVKPPAEPTVNLARELAEDLKGATSADAETLLRKSERYIAKRNYYMARKILRHALAAGGDEKRIKDRLRDIRKLELPDGLYNAISSDDGAKEASDEILDRLEKEFDLSPEESDAEAADLISNIDFQLENIFRETDPRTILDFGIALHEMGLFRQAETVFSRLVDEFPETSFDAYYLAAISKFARKDYAGAASILKTLSTDGGKTELEKIQVYYTLGELFEKMQRPDSSKEFYKKVAELDANYRNIRHKLEE